MSDNNTNALQFILVALVFLLQQIDLKGGLSQAKDQRQNIFLGKKMRIVMSIKIKIHT